MGDHSGPALVVSGDVMARTQHTANQSGTAATERARQALELARVAIGVDLQAADGDGAAEPGIVVAGQDAQRHSSSRAVIVARDHTILAGHGVAQVARMVGFSGVPVVRLDLASDSPAALKVLAGDNELGQLAENDEQRLAEIRRIVQAEGEDGLDGSGYDDESLVDLLRITSPRPAPTRWATPTSADTRWWTTNADTTQPRSPIDIVSKGRWESRLTSKALELMQVRLHPDVSCLVWKWGRPHHHVGHRPFCRNTLKPGVTIPAQARVVGLRVVPVASASPLTNPIHAEGPHAP